MPKKAKGGIVEVVHGQCGTTLELRLWFDDTVVLFHSQPPSLRVVVDRQTTLDYDLSAEDLEKIRKWVMEARRYAQEG